MLIPYLHSVKNCPEKSRLIKYGVWMRSVMIAIEYSHKLGRKIILVYGANWVNYCSDGHIFSYALILRSHTRLLYELLKSIVG